MHTFLCKENGINYLGLNPEDSIIKDNLDKLLQSSLTDRQMLQRKMLEKDLRNGRKNVMNIILNL